MGSEYEVLEAIAIKRKWWYPKTPEYYFTQDCIKYWNGMIEWTKLKKAYRFRQKLKREGRLCSPLNHPRLPRKPISKF